MILVGFPSPARRIGSLGPTTQEPDRDGYTPEQRLFLSWAAVWQTKIRTEMLLQRLATDPHSPAEFRCNQIVSQHRRVLRRVRGARADALWLDEDQRVEDLVNLGWRVAPAR